MKSGIRACPGCAQPVPKPDHYDHASGCPLGPARPEGTRERRLEAALRMFICASMRRHDIGRGESWIGWQPSDGADADSAMTAARAALSGAETGEEE